MNILLGCLIVAVGLFLFVSGTTKSEFVVYRLGHLHRCICTGAPEA